MTGLRRKRWNRREVSRELVIACRSKIACPATSCGNLDCRLCQNACFTSSRWCSLVAVLSTACFARRKCSCMLLLSLAEPCGKHLDCLCSARPLSVCTCANPSCSGCTFKVQPILEPGPGNPLPTQPARWAQWKIWKVHSICTGL